MERVEIVDEVHNGDIGNTIFDVTDDKMELFKGGYNEGLKEGLILGSGFVAGVCIGVSLWNNRKVVLSKVVGMFKKGEDVTLP